MRPLLKVLYPTGAIALVGYFMVAHARFWAEVGYDPFGTARFPWTLVFLGSFLTSAYAVGLPDLPRTRSSALGATLIAVAAGLGAVSVLQLVVGAPLLPRAVIGGSALTLIPWSMMAWNLQGDVAAGRFARVLVIGSIEDRAGLEAELISNPDAAALVVAHITVEAAERSPAELTAAVERSRADVLVLSLAAQGSASVVTLVAELHQRGARIRTMSLFSEEYLGKIPVADLERVSLLFDIGEVHRARYVRTKRIVDVILGVAALPVLAALAPAVAALNLVTDRGPLFYRQERIGKSGEPFMMIKFRSMRVSDGPSVWTSTDDDRVTPAGTLLRRSHLDELPQVWNILRGDLSIVGPRPEQTAYVEELRAKIPYYDVRHLVRPGLTGWAQVKYGYASDADDAREKLQYDLYYLRRQSVAVDLSIVIRTIRAVVRGDGR